MTNMEWTKASASDDQTHCVEVQQLPDGTRRVRDSRDKPPAQS